MMAVGDYIGFKKGTQHRRQWDREQYKTEREDFWVTFNLNCTSINLQYLQVQINTTICERKRKEVGKGKTMLGKERD